jgi:hypothetical protein
VKAIGRRRKVSRLEGWPAVALKRKASVFDPMSFAGQTGFGNNFALNAVTDTSSFNLRRDKMER